jgi:hypothetical protein
MLHQVDVWEKEDAASSAQRVSDMQTKLAEVEKKLSRLVDIFLDGGIERSLYLKKKDALMREKALLQSSGASVCSEQQTWLEPLRGWIRDSHRALEISTSNDFAEISNFVKTFGTNSTPNTMRDKTISISFSPPSLFARSCATEHPPLAEPVLRAPAARARCSLSASEVAICVRIVAFARTHFQNAACGKSG